MLVESKVITKEQLAEVLATPRDPGKKLGQVLLEKGWVTEPQLTQTLSLQLSVPWVSLYHIDFSRQLLNRVSHELAEQYCSSRSSSGTSAGRARRFTSRWTTRRTRPRSPRSRVRRTYRPSR